MGEDAGQERTSDTRVLVDRGMLPVVIVAGVIAFVLMPFVPVGFIVILPVTVFIGYYVWERRAWRRELQDLMSTHVARKQP